jgi:DNA-damage-inducible protein J
MATTNFNLRLEQDLRDRAFPVFERYGLSASQAFKLFLTQVAETNKIPLSFDYAEDEMCRIVSLEKHCLMLKIELIFQKLMRHLKNL